MKRYDPATQQRQIRDRLHALDMINERFARTFRGSLFSWLSKSSDVTAGNVTYISQAQIEDLGKDQMNYNLISMKPLRGTGLFTFPNSMIFMAIENLFGGDGRPFKVAPQREYTPTEQRIIDRMLSMAMEAYRQAWNSVYAIKPEYIRSESVAKFSNIASSATENLIHTKFSVELSNFEGAFYITLPFSMIEPIKEKLTNTSHDHQHEDPELWSSRVTEQIQDSRIELVCDFLYIDTSIRDFMAMQVGDVLPISLPKEVTARVDDVPVMVCDYGAQGDQNAIRVKELINHATLNTKPPQRFVKGASKEVKDI